MYQHVTKRQKHKMIPIKWKYWTKSTYVHDKKKEKLGVEKLLNLIWNIFKNLQIIGIMELFFPYSQGGKQQDKDICFTSIQHCTADSCKAVRKKTK